MCKAETALCFVFILRLAQGGLSASTQGFKGRKKITNKQQILKQINEELELFVK